MCLAAISFALGRIAVLLFFQHSKQARLPMVVAHIQGLIHRAFSIAGLGHKYIFNRIQMLQPGNIHTA
jgi:hypothetical protein